MSVTGEPEGAPMKHGVALVDVLVGKDATAAILAALVARSRTGVGRRVDVSLSSTARAALINVAQNTMVSGKAPSRWGNAHANLVPYQLFQALDRPLVIAVGSDGQWLACVRALGLNELANDSTLATNAGRLTRRDHVVRTISERVAGQTAAEWRELLDAAGVPCGMVRTVPEVLAEAGGSQRMGLPPSVPGSVRLPPPKLGEHVELVRTMGWDAFANLAMKSR